MTGDCHAGIRGSRGLQRPRRPDRGARPLERALAAQSRSRAVPCGGRAPGASPRATEHAWARGTSPTGVTNAPARCAGAFRVSRPLDDVRSGQAQRVEEFCTGCLPRPRQRTLTAVLSSRPRVRSALIAPRRFQTGVHASELSASRRACASVVALSCARPQPVKLLVLSGDRVADCRVRRAPRRTRPAPSPSRPRARSAGCWAGGASLAG